MTTIQNSPWSDNPDLCEVDFFPLQSPRKTETKFTSAVAVATTATFLSLDSLRSESKLILSAAAGKPRVKPLFNTRLKAPEIKHDARAEEDYFHPRGCCWRLQLSVCLVPAVSEACSSSS